MKTLTQYLLLCIVACLNPACDDEPATSNVSRSVKNFNAIVVDAAVNVRLYQANYTFLRLEGYKNSIADIKTEVRNKVLYITGNSYSSDNILVHIQFKDLIHIENKKNGRIDSKMDLKMDGIVIDNEANGNLWLSGLANIAKVSNAASGNVDLSTFSVADAHITNMGNGDMYLQVYKTLQANIQGNGDVFYYGSPSISRTGIGNGNLINLEK